MRVCYSRHKIVCCPLYMASVISGLILDKICELFVRENESAVLCGNGCP